MRLVITGGHHSSALPVIKKIQESYKDIQIFWLGHRHSLKNDKNDTLEYLEITKLKIPFYELKAGKVYKTYDLARLIRVPLGFFQALSLLRKIKPDLILSFGGYLAAPVVVAGKLMGIPSITHEQTLVAGYANKVIAKFADKVMISWEQSRKYFSAKKTVFVGLPLRSEIFVSLSQDINIDNTLPTIYVTAGKTGSVFINNLIRDSLYELLLHYNVIHQCGDYSEVNSFDELTKVYATFKDSVPGKYFVKKFVFDNEIGEIYSKSTMVISRSGAHTVNELLALNKPAILIPIPWVSHNEQNVNAEMLKNSGLAEILHEKDASTYVLIKMIGVMLSHLKEFQRTSEYKVEHDPVDLILNEVLRYRAS